MAEWIIVGLVAAVAVLAAKLSAAASKAAKAVRAYELLKERSEMTERNLRERLREREELHANAMREKERFISASVETLREQFANLAARTLKIQSGDLVRTNSQQLELALKPLRDQVERLKSATEKTQTEHAKLAETIGKDVGRISDVAKELAGVSDALNSNIRFQGRKGEEILADKLRQAGLEENVNFFLQTGTAADRPDAQVCDADNRWLVIDSKVVLSAYFQYAEAADTNVRAGKLKEHVERVREKIDQLAKKNYPKALQAEHPDRNYLPVTAMFVAYEAPLLEALKADPSLWKRAVDGNVILVTPLTLIAYLRLVYLAWQHEKESRNLEAIFATARELLNRTNEFLKTFESLGKTLGMVQREYDDAAKLLIDSPRTHSIAKSAGKLLSLQVRLEGKRGSAPALARCLREAEST